jgi:hypothetical protein
MGRPVLLHVSLAFASSYHPPRNAAYSIGTSSSLRRGEGIPDKPIRIQSSREQFRQDVKGMRAIAVSLGDTVSHLSQAIHRRLRRGRRFLHYLWFLDHKSAAQRAETGRPLFDIWFLRETRPMDSAASTLVVLITLFATYDRLGFIAGNYLANDSEWTAIFAANIHFGLVRTTIQSRTF